MDIRIPFLNAFKLRITGNITSGTHTETADMNVVRNLIVNFVRRGRIFQAHGIDMQGRIVILNLGTLPSGTYGVELVGYYNGEPWRFFRKDVFEIVRQNSDATPAGSGDVPTYDVTFELNFGGESVSPEYVDAAIAAHDADEQAHADIREALQTLEAELRQEIAEAGEVNDVQIDGQSILDPETKVANIDSSQFGKVDDVKVNGISVLDSETKEANINITASVVADDEPGTPAASATMQDGNINIEFEHVKGEPLTWDDLTDQQKASLKGDQGDSAVYDPNNPSAPDFVMANTTGGSTTKSMTQKAVTEALASQNIADWEDAGANKLTSMKFSDNGTVTSQSTGGRVYVIDVVEGDFVKIVATRDATPEGQDPPSIKTVVAIFDSTPAVGDEAEEVLDVKAATADGIYTSKIAITRTGVLAVSYWGASSACTISKGVTYNEQTSAMSQQAITKTSELEASVSNVLGGVEEEKHPGRVQGQMIKKTNERAESQYFSITVPIQVEKGDVVRYIADGGSGGVNSIMNLTDEEGSAYVSLGPDREGKKTRTYKVLEDGYICISFLTANDLEIYITHEGLQAKVESLEKSVATYKEDGTITLLENPLEHLISYPSRVRTFKSYGIIGASFETGYTNASGGQVFYDDGYEWPTLMGKVNGVEICNYALPGHTFRSWLADRNETEFSLSDTPFFGNHYMPWDDDRHTPECFIVNLSSNDVSTVYDVGDPGDIDTANDYTDFNEYPINSMNFCQAATAILQLIRKKCQRCYIFVATVRKGVSNTTRAEALNEALVAIASKFSKCFVLDVYQYGMDWSQQGPNKYVSGGESSHPTRLGHIYLADQFNTYIDWYIGKHPELFLDAAYVNPHKIRVNEGGTWHDQDETFNR